MSFSEIRWLASATILFASCGPAIEVKLASRARSVTMKWNTCFASFANNEPELLVMTLYSQPHQPEYQFDAYGLPLFVKTGVLAIVQLEFRREVWDRVSAGVAISDDATVTGKIFIQGDPMLEAAAAEPTTVRGHLQIDGAGVASLDLTVDGALGPLTIEVPSLVCQLPAYVHQS